MRILWLSEHPPTQEQETELYRIFGPVPEAVQTCPVIQASSEVRNLMHLLGCQTVVDVDAVLPLHVVADLTRMGVKPIRAVMVRKDDAICFSHFERIERVDVISVRL